MVIEHLGKDAQHCGFVLINGTFDIDIEQDGFRFHAGSPVDQHEGCRIISKLLPEHLYDSRAIDFLILKDIREHLEQVRFTTAKEA